MKLSNLQHDAPLTRRLMFGSGYESLKHALFKFVTSPYIIHFPLDFLTITTFTSQVKYWIFLTWLAEINFFVSSVITFILSSPNFLHFRMTGFAEESKTNLWWRKFGSIPSMSVELQENAPILRLRTSTSLASNWGSNIDPIFTLSPLDILASLNSFSRLDCRVRKSRWGLTSRILTSFCKGWPRSFGFKTVSVAFSGYFMIYFYYTNHVII